LLVFLFCQLSLKAQIILKPVPQPSTKVKSNYQENAPLRGNRAITLNLPFFDDFSTSNTAPSAALWEDNGGVYVNNQLAINPPSFNVATFDGIDFQSQPYNFSNPEARGTTDQLGSHLIDLSTYIASDNLYFSFFWQAEGLGELPDEDDSLNLQFKDNLGEWNIVWSVQGGTPQADFAPVIVQLTDPKYFHSEFQFRFQSFGRQSGVYDAWHIDYIYFDANRSNTVFIKDVACSAQPNAVLSKYTAMPINQFLINPSIEVSTSVKSSLNNLNNIFNSINYSCILEDTVSNTNLGTILTGGGLIGGEARNFILDATPNASLIPNTDGRKVLRCKFIVQSGDNNTTIPGIDLTRNDTISSIATLDNFYAYDDGSAEYGAGINQRFGKVAYRFVLNEPDTLTEIRMNIVPLERNLIGETFVLAVWKRLDNQDASVLFIESYAIEYPDDRNAFLSFQLPESIALSDTFYLGWQQTSNERMSVGFDANTNSGSEIFYSVDGQEWLENTDIEGSLLFRPVFGIPQNTTVTSLEPEIKEKSLKIYPNPTKNIVNIENQENIENLILLDMQGKVILEKNIANPSNSLQINLPEMTEGIYLLKILDSKGNVFTEKLLIQY